MNAKQKKSFFHSLRGALAVGLPVGFWLWLAFRMLSEHFTLTPLNPVPLLVAAESLIAGSLLLRRREEAPKPIHWSSRAIILAGAFLGPLAIEQKMPVSGVLSTIIVIVSSLGLALTIWALVSLGKSFGITPADRGLVERGPYRFIRHPMYMGSFLNLASVVAANATPKNLVILAVILGVSAWRIFLEEKTVSAYAPYARRVRWRLIPGIF